jgi:hypothetical protein
MASTRSLRPARGRKVAPKLSVLRTAMLGARPRNPGGERPPPTHLHCAFDDPTPCSLPLSSTCLKLLRARRVVNSLSWPNSRSTRLLGPKHRSVAVIVFAMQQTAEPTSPSGWWVESWRVRDACRGDRTGADWSKGQESRRSSGCFPRGDRKARSNRRRATQGRITS